MESKDTIASMTLAELLESIGAAEKIDGVGQAAEVALEALEDWQWQAVGALLDDDEKHRVTVLLGLHDEAWARQVDGWLRPDQQPEQHTSPTDEAGLTDEDLQTLIPMLATVNTDESRQALAGIHQRRSWNDVLPEVWERLVVQLPKEDQARLAGVNKFFHDLVLQVAPFALDRMTPHGRTGSPDLRHHGRTIYTQSELDASLAEKQPLVLTPGQGSDLTIDRWSASDQAVILHGPHPLTAVSDNGWVQASGQARITTVSGGTVYVGGQATITTVKGGNVNAYGRATITDVSGGVVRASDHVTVTCSAGGTVIVNDPTVTVHNNGGTIRQG